MTPQALFAFWTFSDQFVFMLFSGALTHSIGKSSGGFKTTLFSTFLVYTAFGMVNLIFYSLILTGSPYFTGCPDRAFSCVFIEHTDSIFGVKHNPSISFITKLVVGLSISVITGLALNFLYRWGVTARLAHVLRLTPITEIPSLEYAINQHLNQEDEDGDATHMALIFRVSAKPIVTSCTRDNLKYFPETGDLLVNSIITIDDNELAEVHADESTFIPKNMIDSITFTPIEDQSDDPQGPVTERDNGAG